MYKSYARMTPISLLVGRKNLASRFSKWTVNHGCMELHLVTLNDAYRDFHWTAGAYCYYAWYSKAFCELQVL